jgi:uncharacterized protein (DUF2141 family)
MSDDAAAVRNQGRIHRPRQQGKQCSAGQPGRSQLVIVAVLRHSWVSIPEVPVRRTLTSLVCLVLVLPLLAAGEQRARLVVDVGVYEHTRGDAKLLLFRFADGFPKEPGKAYLQRIQPIRGERVVFAFGDLAPGTYAVSTFHDEDSDMEFDMGLFGPTEGYGVSNDAKPKLRAPRFHECAFQVTAPETRIRITLRY